LVVNSPWEPPVDNGNVALAREFKNGKTRSKKKQYSRAEGPPSHPSPVSKVVRAKKNRENHSPLTGRLTRSSFLAKNGKSPALHASTYIRQSDADGHLSLGRQEEQAALSSGRPNHRGQTGPDDVVAIPRRRGVTNAGSVWSHPPPTAWPRGQFFHDNITRTAGKLGRK